MDLPSFDWADPRLERVTSLFLASRQEDLYWTVWGCLGRLRDDPDREVWVLLPFVTVPKGNVRGTILDHARLDDVFAEGLGFFEPDTITYDTI